MIIILVRRLGLLWKKLNDHSATFVTRTLPSGSPRTETLSSRAAAYKPERNRLRRWARAPGLV
jgi:hypothetical protein